MTPQEKLEKLKQMMLLLNEGVTKTEFLKSFESAVKLIVQTEQRLIQRIDNLLGSSSVALKAEYDGLVSKSGKVLEDTKKEALDFTEQHHHSLKSHIALVDKAIASVEKKLLEVKDGQDADEVKILATLMRQIKVPTIEEIEKDLPKLGEKIRDALELLVNGEKLEIEAIENLREELDELKKYKADGKIVYVGGGSGGGGRIVKSYDISGSLNGVLKTFSLPAFWRVISVHSSSFPNAFRETTDYTTDASASSITFTDAIDAATTLATGQTILVVYAE